jgi:hypothetical protein
MYLLKKLMEVGMRAGIQSNLKQWNKDISQDLFKVIYSVLGFVNVTVEKDDTMITPHACARGKAIGLSVYCHGRQ